VLRLWITLVENGEDKLTLALPPRASWMIGRDESMNELVLHEAGVSRLHARLVFQESRYVLQDVHSKAGTLVNDEKVEGLHELANGDVFTVGTSTFRCRLAEWSMADEDEHTETLLG